MSDPAWLNSTFGTKVVPPIRNDKARRSPAELVKVLAQYEVATAQRYAVRDRDGKPGDETTCNLFAYDVCDAMGVTIPLRQCNELQSWLITLGEPAGWHKVSQGIGRALASELGWPVLAVWRNYNKGHGHVAILRPYEGGPMSQSQTYVAQAGATCSPCMPYEKAFGDRKPMFFAHE